MNNQSTNLSRIWTFDCFRAYGCLAIIMLHVVSAWRDDPSNSAEFYASGQVRLLLDNAIIPLLVRMAVPFFFMMSGALFLNPNRTITSESIFQHIKKILVNLFLFGYLMAIVEQIITTDSFEVHFFLKALLNLIQEKTWNHLWYLYATIGLYLVTPVLRPWIASVTKRDFRIAIIVAFIIFSVIPTTNDLLAVEITSFGLYTPNGALLWYLLGYYLLNNYDEIMRRKRLVYLCLFLGGALTVVYGIESFRTRFTLIQPYHTWVVLYSAALYLALVNNEKVESISKKKIVSLLSYFSLAVYVIHPIFLNMLYKGAHFYPDVFPPIIGELLIWAFISICSFSGAWIVKKIPVLREYI